MNPGYLLDTHVISHIMQGSDAKLLARLAKLQVGQAVISSVTLAEIEYDIQRRSQSAKLRYALDQVLVHMDVLPWDVQVATFYCELRHSLETL